MDDMRFDLELATSKAERQFKAFIAKAEREMKKLKQQVDQTYTALGKKGEQDAAIREFAKNTRQRRKEMEQAKKDTDSFFDGIATAAKNSNKAMDSAAKGFAGTLRSRKQAMDKAAKETEDFFTRIGQAARSSRSEQDAALKSFGSAVRSSKRSGGGAAAVEDPLIESIRQLAAKDKAIKEANIRHNRDQQEKIDRYNQRQAEKAGKARWEANQDVVKKEQKNADAIADAYEAAYRRIERAARDLSPTQQRMAAQMKNELRALKGQDGVTTKQIRQFGSDSVDTLVDTGKQRSNLRETENNDKRSMDRIVSARKVALASINNAEMLSNEVRERLAAELAADLTKIEANRVGMSKELLQGELVAAQKASAARLRSAKRSAADEQRQSLHNVTRMNKANMVMFGVQQSIEDFQFAGFRGISNNLAMMTSMMGGGTGLAAMAALAAVNLGTMAYSLSDSGQAAEKAANQTQKLIDRYMHLRDVRQEISRGNAGADPMDIAAGGNESRKRLDANNREMRDAITNRNKARDILNTIKEARAAGGDVSGSEFLIGAGAPDSDRSMRLIENRERLAKALDDLSQATGGSVKTLKDLDKAEEQFTGDADKASKKVSELAIQNRNLVNQGIQEDKLNRFVRTLKEFDNIDLSGFGDFGDASGSRSLGDFAAKFRDKMTKGYEQSVEDRKVIDERSLEELQAARSKALDDGQWAEASDILEQQRDIYKQQEKDLETLRSKNQDLARIENDRLTAIAKVEDLEQEVSSELENQIEITKRRIAQQNELIQAIQMQKTASQQSHAADKFGLQLHNIQRDADDQAKAIEQRAEQMRNKIQGMMAADQNNPFLSPMHKAASKAYGEAWLRKIDRDQKRAIQQTQRRQEQAERSAYAKREGVLGSQAQDELRKSQEAQQAGEFGKADMMLQKHRQTLEELRRLQMEQAFNRPRGEAAAAEKRADKTQAGIDASFDKELEMAKAKQAQDQQNLQIMIQQKEMAGQVQIFSDQDLQRSESLLQQFQQMLELKRQIAHTQAVADSPAGAAGVPARAAGGPVTGGSTYLVGENGPELFQAGSTGRIYNTNDTRGLMSMVQAVIAAGDHGGRQVVNNSTNFGTTNVNLVGGSSVQDVLRQAAMATKQQRIRQS